MAYIRKKGQYAYLVESHRGEDGKPRQKVLAYLGPVVKMEEKLAELRQEHPEWFAEEAQIALQELSNHPYAPSWDRRRD